MAKEWKRLKLDDGYFIDYVVAGNGMGGYHPVSITLMSDKNESLWVEITDDSGNFNDFPGIYEGKWQDRTDEVIAAVRFVCYISDFVDGKALFGWMLKPDERYFDSFSAPDGEVILYSYLNTEGKFLKPFSENISKEELDTYPLHGLA